MGQKTAQFKNIKLESYTKKIFNNKLLGVIDIGPNMKLVGRYVYK